MARNASVPFAFRAWQDGRVQQNRSLSTLGESLRTARKSAGLSQAAIADRIGCTIPTVRQAEGGHGLLGSFLRLSAALSMQIGGRSLPQGTHLGERLAAMRTRRGWSRRTAAELADISPTTLAMLERDAQTQLATIVRVADALGIGSSAVVST